MMSTPSITIVSVTGIDKVGHLEAIQKTSAAMPVPHETKLVWIEGMTRASYSPFMLTHLGAHIETDFALVVQADGFGRHREHWTDEFLEYDYIGAPWCEGGVGNGGFSLRSKRLLDACAQEVGGVGAEGQPEDFVVCSMMRHLLVARGLKFAPLELALRFSFENGMFDRKQVPRECFGFHGRHNL